MNPYYQPQSEPVTSGFVLAILTSYEHLRLRCEAANDAQYESELVPLSKGSPALIPQYLLPLKCGTVADLTDGGSV